MSFADRMCAWCGERFRVNHHVQKYCDKSCSQAAYYRRKNPLAPLSPCAECGTEIERSSRGPIPIYCSSACRSKAAFRRYLEDGRVAEWTAKARRIRQGVYRDPRSETFPPSEIFERDGWLCWICDEPVPSKTARFDPSSPTLDHVLPISRGGLHTRANVRLAHLRCNMRRGNRDVVGSAA